MQGNLQDTENHNPDYRFILENLDFLTTDVDIWNIKSKFPQRKKFKIKQNQDLLNLRRLILRDISLGLHELVLYNAQQWQTIVNTIKEKETESAI